VRQDRGQIVARQSVVSSGDAPEVFQPVDGTLDPPAQLVEALIEAERVLSVGVVWNDRLGSALVEFLARSVAVISRVAEHMLGPRHSADQGSGAWQPGSRALDRRSAEWRGSAP